MAGKNIMLSSINESSIRKLSVFALKLSEIAKLKGIHDTMADVVKDVKKRMVKAVRTYNVAVPVYRVNSGECDEIDVTTKTVYACNGIANIPVLLYGPDAGKDRITLATVGECIAYLERIALQLKEATKEANRAYDEAVKSIVPDGAYESYIAGLKAGSYAVKVKGWAFNDYVSRVCKRMGFLGADDSKAVRKFVDSVTMYMGARFRKNETASKSLKAISSRDFEQKFVAGIIDRLEAKNVLRLTGDGFVKLTKEEAAARAAVAEKTA